MATDYTFGGLVGAVIRAEQVLDDYQAYAVLLALLALCDVAGGRFDCAPSAELLASRARVSRATALVMVDALVSFGLVERGGLDGHRRVYRVLPDAVFGLQKRTDSIRAAMKIARPVDANRPGNRPAHGRLDPATVQGTVQRMDGSAQQPSSGQTVTVQGVDGNRPAHGRLLSLDARASSPNKASRAAAAVQAPAPAPAPAHTHESGGGGGELSRSEVVARALREWIHPDQTTDADPLDRRVESLVNLVATVTDGDATRGQAALFVEWMQAGQPLAICRQAVREAAQARRNELDPRATLRPAALSPGLLRAFHGRLLQSSIDGGSQRFAGGGQFRGRAPGHTEHGGPLGPTGMTPAQRERMQRLEQRARETGQADDPFWAPPPGVRNA